MSKIVDVLNADREKHRNHRYGRDYYTKQASIPSGKRKNKEEGTDFWSFLDEDHYLTSPTSSEDIPEINEFDPSLISGYDTENPATQYSLYDDYNLKITVNKDGLLYNPDEENVVSQQIVMGENEFPKLIPINPRSENNFDLDQEGVRVRVNTENLLYIPEEDDNNALKVTHLNQQTHNSRELEVSLNTEDLLFNPNDVENKSTQKEDYDIERNNNIPKIVPRSFVSKNVPKVAPRTNKINQQSFAEKNIISSSLEDATSNSSKTQHPPQNQKEFKITVNTEDLLYIPEDNEGNLPYQDKSFGTKSVLTDVNTNEPKLAPKISKTPSQFSVEEHVENKPVILNKKSDNTLIKKIYSDPVVRSFALTNREQIPVKLDASFKVVPSTTNTRTPSTPDDPSEPEKIKNSMNLAIMGADNNNYSYEINESSGSDEEAILDTNENVSSVDSNSPPLRRQYSIYKGNDLHELQEKHLVANRLGEFSKSFPNLSKFNFTNENCNKSVQLQPSHDMPKEIFVSVRDLKKLFENN